MLDKSFLVLECLETPKKITEQIEKINNSVQDFTVNKVNKILLHNPLEKLVPFNLWFHHPAYRVIDYFENNQHIRSRYYDNTMLTPLVRFDNLIMSPLNKFITELSLYQPFYPETFYGMYDFLSQGHNNSKTPQHILHIGRETKFGSLEAIMLYLEKNQQTYQYNTYYAWLSGGETYAKLDFECDCQIPKINYLDQAFKLTFINSTKELTLYDFVSIDATHTFDSIFKWLEEELDLHANLFYFLTIIQHLKKSSSVIIKMNLIGKKSWGHLFEVANKFFSEYSFFRSDVVHPLNPEIYLYLSGFRSDVKITLLDTVLMNLYRHKIHKTLYLNSDTEKNNIMDRYQFEVTKWIGLTSKVVDNIKNNTFPSFDQKCTDWLSNVNLTQIKQLTNTLELKATKCVLNTLSDKKIKLKPMLPDELYRNNYYRRLIKKRSELNHYKRVMDTKPSRIFTETKHT